MSTLAAALKRFRSYATAAGAVLVSFAALFCPYSAKHAEAKSFKDIVNQDIVPFGDKIISLLYALAFIFFLIGMVRLFFSQTEEGRKKGKLFAIYGIAALAILFAVWGFVRVLLSVLESFNS